MSQDGLGAWPFSTGPGACSGRGWSLAQLGWRGRTRPGQLGSGRCGLTMTPGSGRPGTRGEGGEAGPSPSPGASARQRPAAGCYLPSPLLSTRPGASEARRAAPPYRVGIRGAAVGAGTRGAAGRGGRRAGRRTMRPALNCAARVGPDGARVAECVCVRLSVNADRPQPIGQTPPASPPTATAHWAV